MCSFLLTLSLFTACASQSPALVTTAPYVAVAEAPPVTTEKDHRPDLPENNPAIIRLPAPTGGSTTLTITSWNVAHLGRNSFDLRGKDLLDGADIITFQEVNASESGAEALRLIKVGISERTRQTMCYGLSGRPSGGVEVYGYIWRNDRVSFVKRDGTVIKDCTKNADVIRLNTEHEDTIVREPAVFTGVFKPNARPFVLASVHLVPTRKGPRREVPPLFDSFTNVKLPIIIAGDFNLSPARTAANRRRDAFGPAYDLGYVPVFFGTRTSIKSSAREYSKAYDNFFSREFTLQSASVIDTLQIFKDVELDVLRSTISDHAPITAEFTFQ